MGGALTSGLDQWVDLSRVHWRFAFVSALWGRFLPLQLRYDPLEPIALSGADLRAEGVVGHVTT